MVKIQDRSIVWNNFLDYTINYFLINEKPTSEYGDEYYHELVILWICQLEKDFDDGCVFSDRLGEFYEELVRSRIKEKNIGQFYTPVSVVNLMTELCNSDEGVVNDCACGSGRLLLSAHVKNKGDVVCIDQDVDEVSCKMCVLNFVSHGVRGSVIHQDTLTGEVYHAWRVNNYLYHGLSLPHVEVVSLNEVYNFL